MALHKYSSFPFLLPNAKWHKLGIIYISVPYYKFWGLVLPLHPLTYDHPCQLLRQTGGMPNADALVTVIYTVNNNVNHPHLSGESLGKLTVVLRGRFSTRQSIRTSSSLTALMNRPECVGGSVTVMVTVGAWPFTEHSNQTLHN